MQIQDEIDWATVPVLTLWEPWASLLVHGHKKIETRPKPTSYRGTMLIHTSVKTPKWAWRQAFEDPYFDEAIREMHGNKKLWMFDHGHIIGAMDVTECCPIIGTEFDENLKVIAKIGRGLPGNIMPWSLSPKETAFGNYDTGRSAWLCENFRVLEKPIPYKGSQGYYNRFKGDPADLIFKPGN